MDSVWEIFIPFQMISLGAADLLLSEKLLYHD